MLAGIYYGAMYGGSTTSILVNVPGEAGSVVTLLDGYQMTRKGRAGAALALAAVSSWVAGTLGVVGIMFAASWLADLALRFGPPEYFAITFGGILLLSRLSGARSTFVMVAIGWRWAPSAWTRSRPAPLHVGSVRLSQGVDLVPVIMVSTAWRGAAASREGVGTAPLPSCGCAAPTTRGGASRRRRRAAFDFVTELVLCQRLCSPPSSLCGREEGVARQVRQERHRLWQAERPTTPPPRARWFRCCPWASRSRRPRPSCSGPS
jgi:hypothetical protein